MNHMKQILTFMFAAGLALATGLTDEDRLALMASSRDALIADNALQHAVTAYYEAQQKQKDAVAEYQAKLADAQKKAGCTLDKDYKCVPIPEVPEIK